MKLTAIVALAVALASAPNLATGQDSGMMLTGAEFLSACSKPESEWIGFCHGYVQAVFDVAQAEPAFCAPTGLTRAAIVGEVVQQLRANEALQQLNASAVVYGTLTTQFPCR